MKKDYYYFWILFAIAGFFALWGMAMTKWGIEDGPIHPTGVVKDAGVETSHDASDETWVQHPGNVILTEPSLINASSIVMTGSRSWMYLGDAGEALRHLKGWHRFFSTQGSIYTSPRWKSIEAGAPESHLFKDGCSKPCLVGCTRMYADAMNQQQYEENNDNSPKTTDEEQDEWISGVTACMQGCEKSGASKFTWPPTKWSGP